MAAALDEAVGEVFDGLKASGRYENSVIVCECGPHSLALASLLRIAAAAAAAASAVVAAHTHHCGGWLAGRCARADTSDNGAQGGQGGSSYPLKGWKTQLFEGGVRVPGWVHSPLLPKAVQGTISHKRRRSGRCCAQCWRDVCTLADSMACRLQCFMLRTGCQLLSAWLVVKLPATGGSMATISGRR
jgi:hypothetical protein